MRESLQGGVVDIVRAEDLQDPIHVENARIVGTLDLEGAKLSHPLILRNCYVEEEIVLRRAEIPHVDLSGSHLWGLDADQLRTRDDLDLSGVVTSGTVITLEDARVDGSLMMFGARLSNLNGVALLADNMVVGKDVWAGSGFAAAGQVRFAFVQIRGTLYAEQSRFFNPGGLALTLSLAQIGGLDLAGIIATGEVALARSRVDNEVRLHAARLANSTGVALNARGLEVRGPLWLGSAVVRGITDLGEAHARTVRLDGAEFFSGVMAARITVDQMLDCPGTVTVHGTFDLSSAQLGRVEIKRVEAGELTMDHARVRDDLYVLGAYGRAVSAHALAVDKTAWFIFWVHSLWAHGLHVGQAADLRGRVDGEVVLTEANIGGKLQIVDAGFTEIDLEGARAARLLLKPVHAPREVNLTNAVVGGFEDDPKTWPETLWLKGFQYEVLDHDEKARLDWLRLDPFGYTPSLYDTLANAYKRGGRLEYARKVLIAKQRHRSEEFGRVGRSWNWLLRATVGYGYQTSRAWLWLAGLLGIGTAVYAFAEKTPTANVVQAFNPFVYALDVLLPIVDLGQEKVWVVKGAAQYCSWALIVAGWILTTAVVAGLTNALKRD
jgi:hypothetical protein